MPKQPAEQSPQPKLSRKEKLELRKKQIEKSLKAIEAKEKAKERKVRTRRLVQIGALSEKYFHCAGIEPEAFEQLLKQIVATREQEQPPATKDVPESIS